MGLLLTLRPPFLLLALVTVALAAALTPPALLRESDWLLVLLEENAPRHAKTTYLQTNLHMFACSD